MGHTELNVALSLLGYLCPPLVSVLPMTLPSTVTPSLPLPLPLAVLSSTSTQASSPLPALPSSSSQSSCPTALPCSTLPLKPSPKELSLGLVLNAGMIRIRLTENESTVTHNNGNASSTAKSYNSTKNNRKVEGSYFDFSCVSCAVENTELVLIQTSHRHTQKQYLSFTADDFSLFELNDEEFREIYRKESSSSSSTSTSTSRTPHLGNNDYSLNKGKIFPFLFGTSFHRKSSIIRDGDSASNELALQRNILPCEYKERVVNKNTEECRQKKCPVVLFQVLMSEEEDKKDKDRSKSNGNDKKGKAGAWDVNESDVGTKSVAVCIEFSNITHKHNPQSNFIPKITRLLTPCPPSQIIKNREIEKHIINNREIKNRTISACNTNTNTNTDMDNEMGDNDNLNILGKQMKPQPSPSPSPLLLEPVKTTDITLITDVDNCEREREIKEMIMVRESPLLKIVERKEKKKLQFSMTKISIRVHKLCVDYECSSTSTSTSIQSRMLLSLGSMALSTTIANNSNCYLLKVSVKDLVLHLSNHILRNPLFEQNPLNINGSRNMVEDTTGTGAQHNQGVLFTDGVTHSGGRQVKRFTLDFDRFLDEHDLIQVISVDDVTALVGFNPPKQSSGGLAADLGPDSYSISHHKGQEQEQRQGQGQGGSNYNSKIGEKKERVNENDCCGGGTNRDVRAGTGATKEMIDGERKKSANTQPTNSTSKSAVRVGSTDTSVELTLGLCCVYVCMDSVDVLTVSQHDYYCHSL